MQQSISAIELLSIGPRTYADHWGPSWLAEPPVDPLPTAETPAIPEPIAPVAPAVALPEPIVEGEACTRCGSTAFVDSAIHAGRSIRRDCADCNRTAGFPVWNPTP
jgi:hypothetical protein